MKRLAITVLAVLTLGTFAGRAPAANKALWHLPGLDAAASEVAGFPVGVDASDNVYEWNLITGGADPYNVTGFNYTFALPGTMMYDPYDGKFYYVYHQVFLSPVVYAIFHTELSTANAYDAAVALLTLDHESQHLRLHSGDEGKVNACAMQDMPRFLAKFVAATVQQSVQVPVSYQAQVKYRARVKVRGRWVWRYRSKWVTKVRYESQVQTVTNPAYAAILAASKDVYHHQPPPYSTGTC